MQCGIYNVYSMQPAGSATADIKGYDALSPPKEGRQAGIMQACMSGRWSCMYSASAGFACLLQQGCGVSWPAHLL